MGKHCKGTIAFICKYCKGTIAFICNDCKGTIKYISGFLLDPSAVSKHRSENWQNVDLKLRQNLERQHTLLSVFGQISSLFFSPKILPSMNFRFQISLKNLISRAQPDYQNSGKHVLFRFISSTVCRSSPQPSVPVPRGRTVFSYPEGEQCSSTQRKKSVFQYPEGEQCSSTQRENSVPGPRGRTVFQYPEGKIKSQATSPCRTPSLCDSHQSQGNLFTTC